MVSKEMQLYVVAADDCELGRFGVPVGQFKAKGALIEDNAFFDIASRDQRRNILKISGCSGHLGLKLWQTGY